MLALFTFYNRNLFVEHDRLRVGDVALVTSYGVVRNSGSTLPYTAPEVLAKADDCDTDEQFKELYTTKSDIWQDFNFLF
jgi:hypothetical protein